MSVDWNASVAELEPADQEALQEVVAAFRVLVRAVVAKEPVERHEEAFLAARRRLSRHGRAVVTGWLEYQVRAAGDG